CLDLMAQIEKVGIFRVEELDSTISTINRTLKMAEKTVEIATQSKTTPNFATRLCVQKAVIAMSPQVHAEYKQMKKHVINEEIPVVKLSFSHVVLNHIANIGKGIMTNLIDGGCQQVATVPTPLVSNTLLMELSNVKYFDKFHKALIRSMGNPLPEYGFHSVGVLAAHIVETPSPPESFGVIETKSADLSDNSPRYQLTCSKRRR
ncbi:hypothetical protein PFISCL1PPCAC_22011, partial [Pristionchus fissidentatus]